MSFEAATRAMTSTESVIFTPTAQTSLLVRNTGGSTVNVGPAGTTTFPVAAGELIVFGGLDTSDVLSGKCAAGQTSTLELIWTIG